MERSEQDACDLSSKSCVPCRGGVPPLEPQAQDELLAELQGWDLVDRHHLEKRYTFDDFRQALAFTNAVGAVAEREGHHPDILLSWGRVTLSIWTHKIDGLTESDFILAAKVDALPGERSAGDSTEATEGTAVEEGSK